MTVQLWGFTLLCYYHLLTLALSFTDFGWICFRGSIWWQNHVYIGNSFCAFGLVAGRYYLVLDTTKILKRASADLNPACERFCSSVCFCVWNNPKLQNHLLRRSHRAFLHVAFPSFTFFFPLGLMSGVSLQGQLCSEILSDSLDSACTVTVCC